MNTERDVIDLRDNHAHELRRPTRRASLAAPPRTPGLPVGLFPAVTFVAILSFGSTNAYAQVAQSSIVVINSEASRPTTSFRRLDVNLDPLTLRPVKGARAATLLATHSDKSLHASPISTHEMSLA